MVRLPANQRADEDFLMFGAQFSAYPYKAQAESEERHA
jgi:hypothetical protein